MLYSRSTYVAAPLPTPAAIYLEGFLAEREAEAREARNDVDDLADMRAYCLREGAEMRAAISGLDSHGGQAAALLINIDRITAILDGAFGVAGDCGLNDQERRELGLVRESLTDLLDWHFKGGAAALLPIARHMGLVHECGQ